MFMAVNRASASRVPRGDRQRRPDAGQPQVQPHVRAQVMQPDPGRIREQHQDKGDLRQRLDHLMGRHESEGRQRAVGQQQTGKDERYPGR